MPFAPDYRIYTLFTLSLIALLSLAALELSAWPPVAAMGISPLVIGILTGLLLGNSVRHWLPAQCNPGILFTAKTLLRIAIVLYGLRVSFQEILSVGLAGMVVSCVIVVSTLLIGTWAGRRWFGLDRDTALLSAAGSAVCGAAAVVATEAVLRSEPHKTAVAVATVVCFGTLAMLLYPLLAHWEVLDLDWRAWGVYVGGTVHEVAQVVAIGNALSAETADNAIIVKMTRVLLLVPVLFVLVALERSRRAHAGEVSRGQALPWFALGFLLATTVHSLAWLPVAVEAVLIHLDLLLLTMAMVALGMETTLARMRAAGLRPIYHGLFMFLWLVIAGYAITKWSVQWL